jgi:2-desacetyl-2-hydroxyethyl bacteriochlorophyllide A dehydrogenase
MTEPALPDQACALWITGKGEAELRLEPLAAPRSDEVLVRACYSGISRGTERLVYQGQVPESEYQRMRAPFQAGDFPFPVKYGYASVGRVLAGAPQLLGKLVFCLYPHQSAYVVPEEAVLELPPTVPAARAVLAANMETALNAVWDAGLRAGDRVCVVGAGVLGCLVAYLAARHPGCSVVVVDIDARKAETVRALGAEFALPGAAPRECDVVLHASGAPAGLVSALASAGLEARVVELSWYGDQPVELALGQAFHAKRLCLRSSQVGRVPPEQAPRWSTRRRLTLALSLLAEPVLDRLISAECSFTEAPRWLATAHAAGAFELCRRLVYDPSQEIPACSPSRYATT